MVRLAVPPLAGTGLRSLSYIMIEKLTVVRREKCGPVIGRIPATMGTLLNSMLVFVLGLSD